MDWHYSSNKQQKGPVNGTQLQVLYREGKVGQNTLVWREGMAEWQPYSGLSGEIEDSRDEGAEGKVEDLTLCAYSGDVKPKSQMLQYGDRWVLAEHKQTFVQSLQEGRDVLSERVEGEMSYVGFWWRVLAQIVDSLVLAVPGVVYSIPYYVVIFKQAADLGSGPSAGFGMEIILASLFSIVASFATQAAYDTWMVGKYAGTLGKLAISAKVVNADGSKTGYARAHGRFWGKMLSYVVTGVVTYGTMIVFALIFGIGGVAFSSGDPGDSEVFIFIMLAGMAVLAPLGFFPFWMCAFTKEKKTLHDMVAGTRVIRK